MKKIFLSLILFLMSLKIFAAAIAIKPEKLDDDLPLIIQSDSLNVEYGVEQGTYIGNVIADQGTRHLTADHVFLVHDHELKKFKEIHAFGNAMHEAYIQLIPKPGDSLVKGVADQIIYHPIAHTVTFQGHAKLEQDGRIYIGPLAIYNIDTQIIDSPESSDGRVTMILPAENLKKE